MTNYEIALVNMTDGTVQGHAAGCADLKRGKAKHADEVWAFPAQSKHEAFVNYNSDFIEENEDGSDNYDNCHPIFWLPCADHVPAEDATEDKAPEMSDEARLHALRNFRHLAETAPTETARKFWEHKADTV